MSGDGIEGELNAQVYSLGSWGWLCDLMGVDPDEDVEFPLPGA